MSDYPTKDGNGAVIIPAEEYAAGQLARASRKFSVPIPDAVLAKYDMEGARFVLDEDTLSNGLVATCSLTPEQVFDKHSTARSAPVTTYWVSSSAGNDANTGLTSAQQLQSIGRAIQLGNATGSPYKVYVTGTFYRNGGTGNNNNLRPTQDCAFIARNGRVRIIEGDDMGTPALDGTYTNCYKWARSNVNRVVDITRRDGKGEYEDLTYVATAAVCNVTPGTWTDNGLNTDVYVHRHDGAAVTLANTYVLLGQVHGFRINAAINAFFGNEDGYSYWDVIGGFGMTVENNAGSTPKAVVIDRMKQSFSGGKIAGYTAAKAFAVDNWCGPVWLFNCHAAKSTSDLYNIHNSSYAAAWNALILVNCTGHDPAPPALQLGNQSTNAITAHEDCLLVDIAGDYARLRGGAFHSVGESMNLLAGTRIDADFGDVENGGGIIPQPFRVANTAVAYCYRTQAIAPAMGLGYYNSDANCHIYKRDCYEDRLADGVTQETW